MRSICQLRLAKLTVLSRIWDPATNSVISEAFNSTTNLFCSGHAFIHDDRLLVTGGHLGADGRGEPDANFFDSITGAGSSEKLKAWAARMKAKDGWTLVTGEKAEMDRLLKVLTGDASGNKTHSPLLLIGNEATKVWTEARAFENPTKLIQQIDRVSGAAAATP